MRSFPRLSQRHHEENNTGKDRVLGQDPLSATAEPFQPNQLGSASFLVSQGLGPSHCTSSGWVILSQALAVA